MAFHFPNTSTPAAETSRKPTFVANLPSRETVSASKPSKRATLHVTSKGHWVKVRLPPSPSLTTTPWSLDTPGQDEDNGNDNDLSLAGGESEYSSHDEESVELSDEDPDELSDDEDSIGSDHDQDPSDEDEDEEQQELSDADDDEEEQGFSDEGEEDYDDKIPEGAAALPSEGNGMPAPNTVPHTTAGTATLGMMAAEQDDKEAEETTQANVSEKGGTAGNRDDPSKASAPTESSESPQLASSNTSSTAICAPQPTPGSGTTIGFIDNTLGPILPTSPPMSLAVELLLNEVFKIQEIDHKSHPCQGIDLQGAQCKSSVPRCHSLSIKLVETSLVGADRVHDSDVLSLAMYNMCDEHTKQSAKLAREWMRLAELTEAARKDWLTRQGSLSVETPMSRKEYAEFAAAEVRRILAQDEITTRALQEKTELYNESQKTITQLRTKIDTMKSEVSSPDGLNEPSQQSLTKHLDQISALEKQIDDLTAENSSLNEAREATEDTFVKEREQSKHDLLNAKEHYKVSQKIVETLREDVDALNLCISELRTKESSLSYSLRSTEDALAKERESNKRDLLDAKDLYEVSQKTIEVLREEVKAMNSCIDELTTKESSIRNSLESAQDALAKEKVRSRELEIRLEERVTLGTKTQDSSESKLEKYLRQELDKSQRHYLQQQNDFEKLRNDHVRLQITNATLESQVKQIENVKEQLGRASKREFQELAERNSDLSNQLHHTRSQFEQLKAGLAAMEKENEGETPKAKFSFRDFYRRPKHEPSRLTTPPDQ